jgi:ubiquinone/menaquinone biosynthesis C-methylase UbiE
MATTYDRIGRNYALTRQPDARIAVMITDALGDARSVVNVGAGSGSYEPTQIGVVAVDPSIEMVRQRRLGAAPAVLARAESLPFPDRSFDAALAVLTIHHWSSIIAGLNELRRVASRRVVILTYDPDWDERFWLVARYFPQIIDLDRTHLPTLSQLEE